MVDLIIVEPECGISRVGEVSSCSCRTQPAQNKAAATDRKYQVRHASPPMRLKDHSGRPQPLHEQAREPALRLPKRLCPTCRDRRPLASLPAGPEVLFD
jgi:hypothetical protein